MKLIFIFFSITLIGCASLNQPKIDFPKQVCIDNLKKIIKDNWKLSDDSAYYQTNHQFLTELDTVYDQCINLLYQNEIIDLFGAPTETHKMKARFRFHSSFDYLVSLPCKERADNSWCKFFVFYFDSNLKVITSITVSEIGIRSH